MHNNNIKEKKRKKKHTAQKRDKRNINSSLHSLNCLQMATSNCLTVMYTYKKNIYIHILKTSQQKIWTGSKLWVQGDSRQSD